MRDLNNEYAIWKISVYPAYVMPIALAICTKQLLKFALSQINNGFDAFLGFLQPQPWPNGQHSLFS
jgi:hypothetical protein